MPRWSSFDAAADRRLVHGLNEGDDEALAALYDGYAERLYDYALSLTGDYKAAGDIVHDTFIDACRRAPRMRDHLHLRPWLYGAARRRCITRGRRSVLFWEPDLDFGEQSVTGEEVRTEGELPPSAELRKLLDASLARLEPGDQEALLLAVRHGLRPAEVGIVLGISSRRAAARVARSRAALEAAYATELMLLTERCVAGRRTPPAVEAADAEAELRERTEEAAVPVGRTRRAVAVLPRRTRRSAPPSRRPPHGGSGGKKRPGKRRTPQPPSPVEEHGCEECDRRAAVYPAALLALAPAPMLPAALRHRVVHTATDPELAGYRADIAARGGGLTPAGLPCQPDTPSPYTKRWLFAGGGMAGALATALLAALLMGPHLGTPTIYWPPFHTRPQPSITEHSPAGQNREGGRVPESRTPSPGARPPLDTHSRERTTPRPSPSVPSSPRPPRPGTLAVSPAKVELYGTKTGTVRVNALRGPVEWNAVSSSEQVTVSQPSGDLAPGAATDLTITLRTGLINLPGEATITFIHAETGETRQVTVVWGISLL